MVNKTSMYFTGNMKRIPVDHDRAGAEMKFDS